MRWGVAGLIVSVACGPRPQPTATSNARAFVPVKCMARASGEETWLRVDEIDPLLRICFMTFGDEHSEPQATSCVGAREQARGRPKRPMCDVS
jgi:hypothetical protein